MNNMRKIERKRSADWALNVMRCAPYMTLSTVRPDGSPYALPLSIVVADEKTLYFHCASKGEKIDCLVHCPKVWINAVCKCAPVFEEEKENFTVHYQSAMAEGEAQIVEDDEEKILALRLICERFLPKFMSYFDTAIARSLRRTTVVRISITSAPIGKEKV